MTTATALNTEPAETFQVADCRLIEGHRCVYRLMTEAGALMDRLDSMHNRSPRAARLLEMARERYDWRISALDAVEFTILSRARRLNEYMRAVEAAGWQWLDLDDYADAS